MSTRALGGLAWITVHARETRVTPFRTPDGRLTLDRVYRGYVTVYPDGERAGSYRVYAPVEQRIWRRDALADAEQLKLELWQVTP